MPGVAPVCKKDFQAREAPSVIEQTLEQHFRPTVTLNMGGVGKNGQNQAPNINNQVSFAFFNLFCSAKASILMADGKGF